MKFIAYYRVSTKKQGQSGLGLDSQKLTVKNYVTGKGEIVSEFIEVESGKKNNRVELIKAIAECINNDYTLIIAKLDRLSRNAAFTMTLRDTGVKFIACDIPDANTFTIGLMSSLAQMEREKIAERTKSALNSLKKRGVELGKPENFNNNGRLKGAEAMRTKAIMDIENQKALSVISLLKQQNKSLREIAAYLNNNGFTSKRTVKGITKEFKFNPMKVKRIYERSLQGV